MVVVHSREFRHWGWVLSVVPGVFPALFLHLWWSVREKGMGWSGGRGKSGCPFAKWMLVGGFVPVLGLRAVVLGSVIGCALLFLGWWWFWASLGDKGGLLGMSLPPPAGCCFWYCVSWLSRGGAGCIPDCRVLVGLAGQDSGSRSWREKGGCFLGRKGRSCSGTGWRFSGVCRVCGLNILSVFCLSSR